MEQWTGSNLGKEYKAVNCHPANLSSMKTTSYEMSRYKNHRAGIKISRRGKKKLMGEISTTSDMQIIPL